MIVKVEADLRNYCIMMILDLNLLQDNRMWNPQSAAWPSSEQLEG